MNDFNFFSDCTKKEVLDKTSKKSNLPIILLLIVAAGIVFLEWDYLTNKHLLEESIAELKVLGEESGNTESESLNNEVRRKLEEQTLWLEEVSQLSSDLESMEFINAARVEEITTLVPQEFFISELTININTYSIQGMSTSRSKIAEFEHNLTELDYVEGVFVSSIAMQQNIELYSFSINCRLKEVVEVE